MKNHVVQIGKQNRNTSNLGTNTHKTCSVVRKGFDGATFFAHTEDENLGGPCGAHPPPLLRKFEN